MLQKNNQTVLEKNLIKKFLKTATFSPVKSTN